MASRLHRAARNGTPRLFVESSHAPPELAASAEGVWRAWPSPRKPGLPRGLLPGGLLAGLQELARGANVIGDGYRGGHWSGWGDRLQVRYWQRGRPRLSRIFRKRSKAEAFEREIRQRRRVFILRLASLGVAVAVSAIGVALFVHAHSQPIAAVFTRVGGATRVETSSRRRASGFPRGQGLSSRQVPRCQAEHHVARSLVRGRARRTIALHADCGASTQGGSRDN